MIYRAKCLGIVTLNALPTNGFCCNSEEISSKSPIPKMKLKQIDISSASSIIQFLEIFEKMAGFCKWFSPFFSKSLHIHLSPLKHVSPILLLNGLVMVTNEVSIAWKCFKKGNVREYSL